MGKPMWVVVSRPSSAVRFEGAGFFFWEDCDEEGGFPVEGVLDWAMVEKTKSLGSRKFALIPLSKVRSLLVFWWWGETFSPGKETG